MTRDEHDREDLLAEATALVERAELRITNEAESVFVGFRRDGSASVYFGADPAYHFNSADQLRRAFCRGLLYKAERGKLVSLERRRVPGEVQLLRHELSDEEAESFQWELVRRLRELRSALRLGKWQLVGQVPDSTDVAGRVCRWLENMRLPPPVASTPRTGRS